MKDPDAVIVTVRDRLRPGGRFVAECGGHGCVATIVSALERALSGRGIESKDVNPWYFPTVDEYGERLRAAGFQIEEIALIPQPTPLPGDIIPWLRTLANAFLSAVPEREQLRFLEEVPPHPETVVVQRRRCVDGRLRASAVRRQKTWSTLIECP